MSGLPEEFLIGANAADWMRRFPINDWRQTKVPASIPLGPLMAGTRLLPCLSGQPELNYRITLKAKQQSDCQLAKMALPTATGDQETKRRKAAKTPKAKAKPWARSHLDWFEINTDVDAASLEIDSDNPEALHQALLHCSFRTATDYDSEPQSATGWGETPKLKVPAFSQLTLPDKIKKQVCAPVSLAMVMAYHGVAVTQEDFAALNKHPGSGLYGVWPLNVMTLNRHGMSASVRFFKSPDELIKLLNFGLPVPVSISFAKGELPGAPLPKTGGHVLVVTGIRGGKVYVNDPAAESQAEVSRTYDLPAFCRAWLNHHGIGYIISRKA